MVSIGFRVSKKMREDYRRACKKAGMHMATPLVFAVQNMIQRMKERIQET